jgi:hypothetical protein
MELQEKVRSLPIRSLPIRNEPVQPLVDKLCSLIAKHDFIPSQTTGYKVEVES